MSPGSAHTTRERTAGGGVRDRLLDAAYAEVVAGRWPRMRMADIAAAAGVSRQTLYNEFGSKEGLLQAVVVREAGGFLDGVMHILTGHEGGVAHAVSASTRWALRATADDPLLRALVAGDDGLLPVLTTRAEPLHIELGRRMTDYLRRRRPDLGDRAEAIAEVAIRLTLSYVVLPTDPDLAAERVEAAVHGMFVAARERARS
ncbi:TetR family transcriptional regulator [Nocardiopsis trehalosi]|jgi:AcrR family transcriptional regulator|uniref:TetR family transcriptional regulator n=1 Tax=Nocardiopsis trehalosi TaxID=109329 RepID=UPI000835BA89|nr:TetR family transcriptional regulator [Nocardiopsis trehalosi]